MIDLVVQQLQNRLSTELAWLDLVGGVAKSQKLMVEGVEKTLPVMPDPENPDTYLLLCPDDSRSGIAYFEVLSNGKKSDVSGGRAFMMEANVRLIVWLNTKRLTPSDAIPQAMATIVGKLCGGYEGQPPVSNIIVTPLSEAPPSPALFSRWTYNEAESQFLMLPYQYFGFDFNIVYALSMFCPPVNIVKTSAQC